MKRQFFFNLSGINDRCVQNMGFAVRRLEKILHCVIQECHVAAF